MLFHVGSETFLAQEPFRAEGARKHWPFTGREVRYHVGSEIALPRESLRTEGTRKYRPFTGREVRHHVGSETTLRRETLRAESARKRLFPSVNAKVYYHISVCSESLFANATFMKPFASVPALVSSDIALVNSAEITILTVMIYLVLLLGVFQHV